MNTPKVVNIKEGVKRSQSQEHTSTTVFAQEQQNLSLTNESIQEFFRVLNYISQLSSDLAATIDVTQNELKISTHHCQQTVDLDGTVEGESAISLSASMKFTECSKTNVEDFRNIINYIRIDDEQG